MNFFQLLIVVTSQTGMASVIFQPSLRFGLKDNGVGLKMYRDASKSISVLMRLDTFFQAELSSLCGVWYKPEKTLDVTNSICSKFTDNEIVTSQAGTASVFQPRRCLSPGAILSGLKNVSRCFEDKFRFKGSRLLRFAQ